MQTVIKLKLSNEKAQSDHRHVKNRHVKLWNNLESFLNLSPSVEIF